MNGYIADQKLAGNNGLKATDLALQCAQVSIAMKSHVESVTGHAPALTIGSIQHYSTPLIEVGSGELRQMGQAGAYHVWLTMPWGEIADFTLMASLAVLMGKTLNRVSPLAGFPESISPFVWRPLYVGTAATHYILDPC